MNAKAKQERKKRIKLGIRKKIKGTAEKPRFSVFRSNTTIYAQLIDDTQGVTRVASSSTKLKTSKLNVGTSKSVGKNIAEKAKKINIHSVVFDRSGYAYHGNVKALADGAREGGLKF